jgi:hypothetical protein
VSGRSLDRLYWTRQTRRLRAWLREEHGIELNVTSKLEGYSRWWEAAGVWFVILFGAVGEALRGPFRGAWGRSRWTFEHKFVVTFGDRVYWKAGAAFDAGSRDDFAILLHEAVHVLQAKSHRAFAFQYLFWRFPIFWTKRAMFERVAYHQQLRVYYLSGAGEEKINLYLRLIDPLFWSSAYLWMDLKGSRLTWKKLQQPGVLEALGFELE